MKILIWIVGVVLSLALILFLTLQMLSDPLPEPTGNVSDAEQLADKMLDALGKEAYDTLQLLEWSFPRGHRFVWNKDINQVTAFWDENKKVVFFPDDLTGRAFENNEEIDDPSQKEQMIQKAWSLFANDSFWLVAPYKIRDPGTTRAIVATEEGPGLLVTYQSGGVTPGDSYLWLLDENNLPKAWKMWVGIIPVGGLKFTWQSGSYHHGAWFAPVHKGPAGFDVNLQIHNIK